MYKFRSHFKSFKKIGRDYDNNEKKIYGAHHMSNTVNKFFFVKEINLMKASCHSSTFPTIFFL